MAKFWIFGVAILAILFLASGAMACSVGFVNEKTELRSNTDGYATGISAEINSPIDIMTSFTVNSLSGTDCNGSMQSKAIIYRYNQGSDTWEQFKTTSTKTQGIGTGDFVFIWNDEFSVLSNSNYTRYRVEGIILDSNASTLDSMLAYVDVQDNTCSGIRLDTNTITMNENSTTTKTFTISNNTNKTFDTSALSVFFTNSLITSGSVDYGDVINPYSSTNLVITLNSGNIFSTSTTTGTISLSGNLGGVFCSDTMIGRKNFDVIVQENGTNTNDGGSTGGTSSDCDDLTIQANDFVMNEGTKAQQTFYLKNNGLKRFELLEVKLTQNGIDLRNYYNEKYAFSGELASIVIEADAPNVTQDKTYSNKIQVRGVFSDGKTCSFTNIADTNFNTLVKNKTSASFTGCANLSVDVPASISVENAGVIPFTITNGTDKTATIYVESSLDVSPTIIVLPENTSISRTISFVINSTNDQVTFRPVVDGCTFASKSVAIRNIAQGDLSSVTMTTNVTQDTGATYARILVEINNPSNKTFVGLLQVNEPLGWTAQDRQLVIVPGKNNIEIKLDKVNENAAAGNGKVLFSADGKTITADFGPTDDSGAFFAGFFGLGGWTGGIIALILIIIIAAVLIIGLVRESYFTEKEAAQPNTWKNNK